LKPDGGGTGGTGGTFISDVELIKSTIGSPSGELFSY
jgi:hypothetical protein